MQIRNMNNEIRFMPCIILILKFFGADGSLFFRYR